MKTKSVHVRLPHKVFDEAQGLVDEGLFSSLNEFIKEGVRSKVDEYRRKKALEVLTKHYGSVERKKFSASEKEEILEKFLKEKKRDIIKELGLG